MSINHVVITGNLTRDAELRATASGSYILNLGVAVNDRRRNQQTGEWEDYPNYIDCVIFGSRAQALSNYLVKGTKVAIEGKLRWSQWERDGQKRNKVEVIVDEIEFMSSRNAGNGGYSGGNAGAGTGYAPVQQAAPAAVPQYQAQPQPQPYQAQPQQMPAGDMSAPVIDTSSSVYDEDIPF